MGFRTGQKVSCSVRNRRKNEIPQLLRRVANHCEQADCSVYVIIVDNRQHNSNLGRRQDDNTKRYAATRGDASELGPWPTYHLYANGDEIGRPGNVVDKGLAGMVAARTAASKATIRNSRELDKKGKKTFEKGKVYARVYDESVKIKEQTQTEALTQYVASASGGGGGGGGTEEEEEDDWQQEQQEQAAAAASDDWANQIPVGSDLTDGSVVCAPNTQA